MSHGLFAHRIWCCFI